MKKAFLEVAGEPLLVHALQPFLAHPEVEAVVVALPPADVDGATEWLTRLDARIRVVPGASTRMRSVHRALRALPPSVDVVLVHDAARPLVEREIIDRCLAGVREGEGAVAGWPSTDTLKEVDGDGRVLSTPSRSSFWRAQTPQGFPREMLLSAYAEAETADVAATDDASVFARAGGTVRMVKGSPWNLKVTHPEDVDVATFLLSRRGREPSR